MKKLLRLLATILLSVVISSLAAQVSPDHYLINLADKNNTPYSLDNPGAFLSERAIQRRLKQNIPYNENDLPVNPVYLGELKALGLKIVNVSKWMNSLTVYSKDTLLLDTLDKIPFVKSIGINKKTYVKNMDTDKLQIPIKAEKTNDFDSADYYFYGNSFRQIEMLEGHHLHKEGFRGEGMLIAVLDAGFFKVDELPAFDSIRENNQIVGVYDFVDNDTEVYDASSHGMKVLSTMAGNIPGALVGTAPKAKYLLLRTEQGASEYIIEEHNWVVAAEYADSLGVDMINSSLGYNDFDDNNQDHVYADMDGNTTMISIAADIAASKGILVVTSAGNEGFSDWKYISAPADADSVLSIGAVAPDETIAYFSSRGPTFDKRIKPDVCAMGMPSVLSSTNGSVSTSSGTSFSGPIIAGMVACLWQAHPTLNNMQIIDAVKRSANRYSQPDTIFGFGIPDFYAAHIYLNTTGSIDNPVEHIMNVFPNPFKNYLNVEFLAKNIKIPYDAKLEIFDLHGKKMINILNDDYKNNYLVTKLDYLESLKRGMYIVRLTADDFILQKKVMKL